MARGQIFRRPRKDGSVGYQVKIELPPDPRTGDRRRRVATFDTRAEAEKTLTAWLGDADRGITTEPTRMTMAELLTRWLNDEAAHNVRPTTLAGYRISVEKHLLPRVGSVKASKLTPADVQSLRTELLRDTSPRTTQLALTRLKQALAWAVSVELLPRNPAASVKPPKWTPAERSVWTAEDARTFLAKVKDDDLAPLWRLALSSGLRRGELLALRWQDMNLETGRLTVRQSLVMLGGKAVIQPPKSKAAVRSVALPPDAVAALIAHKDRQEFARRKAGARWQASGLVFTTPIGTSLSPRNLGRSFDAAIARAGVPRIRVHDLRHVSASLDLAHGTSVKAVAARLGHSDPAITLRVYSHVLPAEETAATARLGALLSDTA